MSMRDQIAQGLEDLRMQRGGLRLSIIPIPELDELYRRANSGDRTAQIEVLAVAQWVATANAVVDAGEYLGCIVCGERLHQGDRTGDGDVVAWAVITPGKAGDTGGASAICFRCGKLEPDQIVRQVLGGLSAKIGIKLDRVVPQLRIVKRDDDLHHGLGRAGMPQKEQS